MAKPMLRLTSTIRRHLKQRQPQQVPQLQHFLGDHRQKGAEIQNDPGHLFLKQPPDQGDQIFLPVPRHHAGEDDQLPALQPLGVAGFLQHMDPLNFIA